MTYFSNLRISRSARWIGPLRRLAVGGAWLFIVFSLAHLAWVVWAKWGDPTGLTTLYQTTVGEEVHRAWALSYGGVTGLILALLQASAVSVAAIMSVRSRLRPRLAGHGILIAWSAIWMLNLIRLAALDMQIDTLCQASMMSMLFACTTVRATTGFLPPRRNKGEKVLEIHVAELAQDDVLASDELRDITDEVKDIRNDPPRMAKVHRLGELGRHGWRRAKPVAVFVSKKSVTAGRGLTRYLREKGVIPNANRSTTA